MTAKKIAGYSTSRLGKEEDILTHSDSYRHDLERCFICRFASIGIDGKSHACAGIQSEDRASHPIDSCLW